MKLGEKIEALLREKRMTKVDLAKRLKLADSSIITHWVKGRNPPNWENLDGLAAVFEKPPAYFRDDPPSGIDMSTLTSAEIEWVPVLGTAPAGFFGFSFDAIPEKKIPNPFPGKDVFAIRVSGDSMEPKLFDGEYLYMSATQPVADGKVVLARLDGECTLKRYYRRAGGVELKPDNPKYSAKLYTTNKLRIEAVAIGKWGEV